jgi:succinate dehydrogenase / fumarate reductase cytochrome b subunit
MSATAEDTKQGQASQIQLATIGQKALMSVTGVVLFGFVVVHLLGNLQLYLGRAKLNAYGELLHSSPALLWTFRIVLLVSVSLHAILGLRLARLRGDARPTRYAVKKSVGSTNSSRTMVWSGLLIFFFVIYHLLHFTVGSAHPSFVEGDVYHNVIAGFRVVPASVAYIVAMVGLGFHLHHGAWSMFQSLGIHHPRYTPALRRFGAIAATLIVLGNISMPLAVLSGLVGH